MDADKMLTAELPTANNNPNPFSRQTHSEMAVTVAAEARAAVQVWPRGAIGNA